MSNTTQPDFTRAFLARSAAPNTSICVQTFDDGPGKNPRLARTLHGSFEQLLPELERLNAQGAGIFKPLNKVRHNARRKAENVERVDALAADNDDPLRCGAVEAEIDRHGCVPSTVVETSPGKRHYYWFVNDFPLDAFTPAQRAIAAALGTDPAVCDLPRVMRLPGFIHRKGAPFLVREVAATGHRYSYAELRAAYPPGAGNPSFGPADRGGGGAGRGAQRSAEASPQAAEFRAALHRCGGLFSRAIPAAIAAAKQGQRYLMLRAIIARLAAAGWGPADMRAGVLPHAIAAWTDTTAEDLARQVDELAAWVLQREAEKTAGSVTDHATRLGAAFGAGQ
ncbi:DNA-primase RepB domain-containing protein [Muricoccus pecuniae]|uniref:RepB-like DNA primase domain-containing protein n=1 Tax=Muricoccus pecuniae TaxID=693023 RepID=A0A840YI05_9PROT|nr:DNA-primase RepB domain-containing protein [Roseomonas pecuniae]MBB5693524.1 hypothetical protein [Roseomonas pecuniae]